MFISGDSLPLFGGFSEWAFLFRGIQASGLCKSGIYRIGDSKIGDFNSGEIEAGQCESGELSYTPAMGG